MRILITKVNFLGDAITFLPTLRGLRQALPGASITVVCSKNTESIFRRSVDGIDTLPLDFSKTRGKIGVFTALREALRNRETFDVSLHAYDEPSFSYLLARFLRIKQRIGFDNRIARASTLLTKRLAFVEGRNVVDLNFDLVRSITNDWEPQPQRTPIAFNRQESANVEKLLRDSGWTENQPIVVVHPYAKRRYQEWGIENFKTVAAELETSTGGFVVFVTEKKGDVSLPHSLSGLTIHEFSALCHRAKLFIGNNSGPMHVASAVGTSTLVIQGPTAPEWYVYWADKPHVQLMAKHLPCVPCEALGKLHNECTNYAYLHGCMREINTDLVTREALNFL